MWNINLIIVLYIYILGQNIALILTRYMLNNKLK